MFVLTSALDEADASPKGWALCTTVEGCKSVRTVDCLGGRLRNRDAPPQSPCSDTGDGRRVTKCSWRIVDAVTNQSVAMTSCIGSPT